MYLLNMGLTSDSNGYNSNYLSGDGTEITDLSSNTIYCLVYINK
jgi:hypothetical protein